MLLFLFVYYFNFSLVQSLHLKSTQNLLFHSFVNFYLELFLKRFESGISVLRLWGIEENFSFLCFYRREQEYGCSWWGHIPLNRIQLIFFRQWFILILIFIIILRFLWLGSRLDAHFSSYGIKRFLYHHDQYCYVIQMFSFSFILFHFLLFFLYILLFICK